MNLLQSQDMPWDTDYVQPRAGRADRKVILAGELVPDVNFMLYIVGYGSGAETFNTPRHKHIFDQIRFPLDGPVNYAKQKDIPVGSLGFFPAGAHYGPQAVDGGSQLLLQFGENYINPEDEKVAHAELAEHGTFDGGIYSVVDEGGGHHNKDAVQAIYEHIHKRPLVYPKPRYAEPIVIDPSAFAWAPVVDGVRVRNLGVFNERPFAIKIFEWDADADLELPSGHAQLGWAVAGELSVGDQTAGAGAALWSQPQESTTIAGRSGLQLLVYEL